MHFISFLFFMCTYCTISMMNILVPAFCLTGQLPMDISVYQWSSFKDS